ncbi:MAG: DUF177 domain-containing protein [Clostridiaceae bacterium]|nr:DUF177 domain-containing protein [Clostridiaceae bacterium]
MRIDISKVIKTPGSKMEIYEAGIIENMKNIYGLISVTGPVVFKGSLNNINGMLRLNGKACCTYETQCDICGNKITRDLQADIHEVLVKEQTEHDDDQYVYKDNWLELDKILSDNIVLSLPMSHRCSDKCDIICTGCGKPVTGTGCGCEDEQPIDPRLVVLKELIEDDTGKQSGTEV